MPPEPRSKCFRRSAEDETLLDPYGRPLRDLRLSVTRDCQLACVFCHHEGARPGPERLSVADFERIVRVAASLGVESVKLTGGEPLLRRDLGDIIEAVRPHVKEVSIVTNGHLLGERAAQLKEAGLSRANVSVHTLDPETYRKLTHVRGPPLDAIQHAKDAGLPVKANMVVTRDTLPHVRALVEWAMRSGVHVQLIEVHGSPEDWPNLKEHHVPLDTLEAWLGSMAVAESEHRLHGRPRYDLGPTTVEVTRPMNNGDFCSKCSRLRVTADGRLQTCLLRPKFVDILGALRTMGGDAALESAFEEAVSLRRPTWFPRQEVTVP